MTETPLDKIDGTDYLILIAFAIFFLLGILALMR